MEVQEVIATEDYDSEEMEPLSVMIGDFAAAMSSDNITMLPSKNISKLPPAKRP